MPHLHPIEVDDLKQRPYIDVIAKAENVVNKNAEFDLKPEQYTRLLGKCGTLSLHAIIPDSPKYKLKENGQSTKPVPKQDSSIAASGFITRVIPREDDPDEQPDQFCVSVDAVTFLGRTSSSIALPEMYFAYL
ncbi:hypothetical protein GYMLUDRAFT_243082 [Collybiopsis luxurians FD-317 M1]|uniref:Uncharacterized protein n=1 Tax=Collybiopsis luxurians FD-317 M1 TaxID=944289 RepID=A0A0D0BDV0_9AGAR|nr:hypothetical protein GYMLUDRAFT_243082 [Collybiopsis luxurians FD-317 M1]